MEGLRQEIQEKDELIDELTKVGQKVLEIYGFSFFLAVPLILLYHPYLPTISYLQDRSRNP